MNSVSQNQKKPKDPWQIVKMNALKYALKEALKTSPKSEVKKLLKEYMTKL